MKLLGKKWDLIIWDLCTQGQIEILYNYRSVTDYIVGSPNTIPTYNHVKLLQALCNNDKIETIGKKIVDDAVYHCEHFPVIGNVDDVFSLYKLSNMFPLLDAINNFGEELYENCSGYSYDEMVDFQNRLKQNLFTYGQYSELEVFDVDLGYFCQYYKNNFTNSKYADEVLNRISDVVLYYKYTSGFSSKTSGISIFLPLANTYGKLNMIEKYYKYYPEATGINKVIPHWWDFVQEFWNKIQS